MNLSDIAYGTIWQCEHCFNDNTHNEPIEAGDELQCDYCDSTYIVENFPKKNYVEEQ